MRGVLLLCCLVIGLVGSALAQSLLKQADHQFDRLAYSNAINLYEEALNRSELSEEERLSTLSKLAYSYRQLRDMPNAERVYRSLFGQLKEPKTDYIPCYLYYAQTLASNGKYRESQEVYELYSRYQNDDQRGKQFSKLYKDISILSRNPGNYKIDFLEINTSGAEFSPMYYKDGLVFVTNKRQGGPLKRVFSWDNSPFLDLYFMPDATNFSNTVASLGGGVAHRTPKRVKPQRTLGEDAYTDPTANDSRTLGFNGGSRRPTNSELNESAGETKQFARTLNTKYHEGPVAFTKDGSKVFFTRNNYNQGKYRESSDGINKLKLYVAEEQKGAWGKAHELPFNSDEFSTGHPALSPSDNLLYFASDRPGGFGGTDLYVSRFDDGKWSEPVNLGKDINTKGNELFPFVDDRGNLYFSSDGHPGLGDLDIFYAQLVEGTSVKSVQNMGEPLNSSRDDFGIVTDGVRMNGYFSSNRLHGGTDDDIYRFQRIGSLYTCRELTINVFDAQTKQPLGNAQLDIDQQNLTDGKRLAQTDAEGNVRLCLDPDSDFRIAASLPGFQTNRLGFSTRGLADDQPLRLEIPLNTAQLLAATPLKSRIRGRILTHSERQPIDSVAVILRNLCDSTVVQMMTGADGSYEFMVDPGCEYLLEAIKDCMGTTGARILPAANATTELMMFRAGDIIEIENIYYDLDKWTIRPDAAVELNKLVALMKKYPRMRIELRSHTDSRASAAYNKVLSTKRARAVVNYLVKGGISAKRMKAAGYGESLLLNGCKDGVKCTEAEHQRNRRTEIKILQVE
ncbi:OmpA family protein [Larkinella sp. VNQ87]|uniref:OmpA family protein n=1 Tax=Larkinella sp. VNQ87 TaxID=3400921 RepID=UPI003C028CC2